MFGAYRFVIAAGSAFGVVRGLALRAIKESKTVRDTKVMILSNLGQKEEIEKGLALGASRYLIKAHYTPSEAVAEVQKLIGE